MGDLLVNIIFVIGYECISSQHRIKSGVVPAGQTGGILSISLVVSSPQTIHSSIIYHGTCYVSYTLVPAILPPFLEGRRCRNAILMPLGLFADVASFKLIM